METNSSTSSSSNNHHRRPIKTEPVDNPPPPHPLEEEDDAIRISVPGPSSRRKRGREDCSGSGGEGAGIGTNGFVPIKTEIFEKDCVNEKAGSSKDKSNQDDDGDGRKTPPIPNKKHKPNPLMNIFAFASDCGNALPQPEDLKPSIVETKVRANELAGGPAPLKPRFAAYNTHTEEDEFRYVEENEAQVNKVIMDPDRINESKRTSDDEDFNDEDEADDSSTKWDDPNINEATLGRIKEKEKVYTKYDFTTRRIDCHRLAVYGVKDRILSTLTNHRIIIVDGYTGCGKTTQVPQFILDDHYEKKKLCNIVVTQPRKIAAISVARRVCSERNWKLGDVVGYQVGMDTQKKEDTLLTYVTTGVLLEKLIAWKTFGTLTHIIIDEVHERDLESDQLLLVIKKILVDDDKGEFKHVKFILMSATLNAAKFSTYFPTQIGETEITESPVIKIPQSFRHRVEEIFLDDLLQNNQDLLDQIQTQQCEKENEMEKAIIPEELYTVAVDCIVSLDELDKALETDPRRRNAKNNAKMENRGSVLVFLPGMEEINRLNKALNAKNKDDVDEMVKNDPSCKTYDAHQWDIVPLHSTITNDEQQRVFHKPRNFYRKVILSTNIAESSVTVPDVMYVVDFCLTKSLCIDSYTNFTTLRMVWASVSQCIQRKGRTGRVGDGKVFRLVTKNLYARLPQDTRPEMLRSNLETVVLKLKKLDLGPPKELLAMALDPPSVGGIERAVANLKELGALTINVTVQTNTAPRGRDPSQFRRYHQPPPPEPRYDTCDGDLTFLGEIMADLPIPQQCTRLIMLGYCFGVLKESIVVAAALSVKNPFVQGFQKALEAYLSRLNCSKKSMSDLFALYHVYKHWMRQFAEGGNGDTNNGNDSLNADAGRSRTTFVERQWARGAFVQLSVLREIKSTVNLIEERLGRYIKKPSEGQLMEPGELSKEAGLMLKLAIAGAFYPNYFHRRRPDASYEREKSKEICGMDLLNTIYFKGFPTGHDGKVYAKYISDYLSFGLNVPSIKFDGQKVLATFDNRGDKIGPINKGIYRAIKRRQLRENLEFPQTSRDHEKSIMKRWNEVLAKRNFTRCPPQVTLPGIEVPKVYVRVTHIESPGQFWINYSSRIKDLDEMIDRVNRINQLSGVPLPRTKLVPNAMCLAPYQGCYYRARILLVLPYPIDDSLVYFIDYGNSAWVKNSTMQDFTPSMVDSGFTRVPCLAVECRLSNIKPAAIHGAGWHDTAKKEFQMFAENAPYIFLEVYSVHKSVIAARLIGHDENQQFFKNFNDQLLNVGFAEPMEEPGSSKYNHTARERVKYQVAEERAAHNKEQIGEMVCFDLVQAKLHTGDNAYKSRLKGPWSPLELEFSSLCQSSNTKQVQIDRNSVNSVVLDTEPTAPISRLLVASSVGIQDKTGSVVARETTIMPAVPGMLSLMAMVFAPKIEMRIDVRGTKYTGVLCGLGTTPDDADDAVYGDHDVEIVFDTVIDDADIDTINKIRYIMNLILKKYPKKGQQLRPMNLSSYQTDLKNELVKLLQRKRPPILSNDEVWPPKEFIWNQIGAEFLVPPPRNYFNYEPSDIFTPHNKVQLTKDNPGGYTWNYAV